MTHESIPLWTPHKKVSRFVDFSFHAKERASQRFGQELSFADLEEMAFQIQSGKAEHLSRSRLGMGIYAVWHKGTEFPVYFSKRQNCIASILPASVLTEEREKKARQEDAPADSVPKKRETPREKPKKKPKYPRETLVKIAQRYSDHLKAKLFRSIMDNRQQLLQDSWEIMQHEEELVDKIQNGQLKRFRKVNGEWSLYLLEAEGEKTYLLYFKGSNRICGVMSEEELQTFTNKITAYDQKAFSREVLITWHEQRLKEQEEKAERQAQERYEEWLQKQKTEYIPLNFPRRNPMITIETLEDHLHAELYRIFANDVRDLQKQLEECDDSTDADNETDPEESISIESTDLFFHLLEFRRYTQGAIEAFKQIEEIEQEEIDKLAERLSIRMQELVDWAVGFEEVEVNTEEIEVKCQEMVDQIARERFDASNEANCKALFPTARGIYANWQKGYFSILTSYCDVDEKNLEEIAKKMEQRLDEYSRLLHEAEGTLMEMKPFSVPFPELRVLSSD